MSCTYYREQVSLFVDNELDAGSQTKLFDHLAGCMECHLFLDSIMQFKSMKHRDTTIFPTEIDSSIFEEIKTRNYFYKLGRKGLQVKVPFWKRRVALSLPALTAMIVAVAIGISTLFVNILSVGGQPTLPPTAAVEQSTRVEKREVIVYGVPGVTVYGQSTKAGKSEL
jgi:hypothetical protein